MDKEEGFALKGCTGLDNDHRVVQSLFNKELNRQHIQCAVVKYIVKNASGYFYPLVNAGGLTGAAHMGIGFMFYHASGTPFGWINTGTPTYCSRSVRNPAWPQASWDYATKKAPNDSVMGVNFPSDWKLSSGNIYINGKNVTSNNYINCYSVMLNSKDLNDFDGIPNPLGYLIINNHKYYYKENKILKEIIPVNDAGYDDSGKQPYGAPYPGYTFEELTNWQTFYEEFEAARVSWGYTIGGWSGPQKSGAISTAKIGVRKIQSAVFFKKHLTTEQLKEVTQKMIENANAAKAGA